MSSVIRASNVRRITTLILCAVVAAVFCAWVVVRKNTVQHALWKQVHRGPGAIVTFAEIAPFAWDRLYVFGPYTSPQRIHDNLGFHWPGVRDTTIASSDGVNLVVFVKDGQVVDWLEYPRNQVELIELANPQGYSREEASFQVYLVDPGQRLALAKREK